MTAAARPSASICLLGGGDRSCRVLMAQRGIGARFMGGAWVFPGGVVDELDRTPAATAAVNGGAMQDAAWRAAALRELVEEVGVWLSSPPRAIPAAGRPYGVEIYEAAVGDRRFAADRLRWFSTWVTPSLVPVRFDARFYVVAVDDGVEATPDGREMDAVAWIDPAEAIRQAAHGSFLLPFPTRKTLEHFAALGSTASIVAHAESLRDVPRIQPRLRITADDTIEALLPGDPGFDEAADLPPDPEALARATKVTSAHGEPIPELGRRGD